MRRIMLVLSIATLMAAMVVASAMPAFADIARFGDPNGTPAFSGDLSHEGNGAVVRHCGGSGVIVSHNGEVRDNNCDTGGPPPPP